MQVYYLILLGGYMPKSKNFIRDYQNLDSQNNFAKKIVCIVGLGYVGLPLAKTVRELKKFGITPQ